MRKLTYVSLYLIYLLLAIVLVDYFLYRIYLHKLNKDAPCVSLLSAIKNVDGLTKSRLGFISTDKKSSFVNFNEKKERGIIRIGCFGDSFTHGDEVGSDQDYPSILQDIFIKAGKNNVEVINFGTQWYGFSQSFMMWKYVGIKYGLDYILLGPGMFDDIERETSFNHTMNTKAQNIYYQHARFVLENGNIRLVDVYGGNCKERMENYFRFFPLIRYLRFDINPPAFLSCLIPEGRKLNNPFYYNKGSLTMEAAEIDKLLILEMLNSGSKVIAGNYYPTVVRIASTLKFKNFNFVKFYHPEHFPYLMMLGHNSPLGNQIVAKQMFDLIAGEKTSQFGVIDTVDIDKDMLAKAQIEQRKLSEYADMKIELNGSEWGSFVKTRSNYSQKNEQPNIKESTIESFLAIKRKSSSILDAVFVPLGFKLAENSSLKIYINSKNQKKNLYIGNVRLLNPGLGIGVVDLEGIRITKRSIIQCECTERLLRNASEVSILLNDKEILRGVRKNQENNLVELWPVRNNLIVIQPKPDSLIDVEGLEGEGVIYLSLYTKDGKKQEIPFARWIKNQKIVSFCDK
ncbi:MAG: SGNH/GDSL hydrolase family protein [Candidatus Omnitrophica bacterium]|nr:SGNH/GDSL hydrolase family protein [Candidatus Omnitrophota bacterium]